MINIPYDYSSVHHRGHVPIQLLFCRILKGSLAQALYIQALIKAMSFLLGDLNAFPLRIASKVLPEHVIISYLPL